MASGFSVMDTLNRNSKAGIEETPKARFRTKDVSIFKMYRNEMNFYSIAAIEELAGDILAFGLKQNLEIVYEPCEKGEYRIVAGERRWLALKLLVSRGYKEFEMATSKLTVPQDADEEQVEIIIANAYRDKSVADMVEEEKRLKESLGRIKASGKRIKGYDLTSGRLRDVIASMLHISKTKVAQIESVNNRLIPEFKEEMKGERLTFSAAYELSGMPVQEQEEAFRRYAESGELSHKDVRGMKKGERAETEEVHIGIDLAAGEEYQPPHPEGITSLCYSCVGYEECNVRIGTCTKCDRYRNRAEAYKTEGQRYLEEQGRIDRETARKLHEQESEERLDRIPDASERDRKKVHQIRVGASCFEDVRSGKKSFELRKNDRGYREGDILEMMEFLDGRNTGRMVRVLVTYILEDYTGLEEGYCIMATVPIDRSRE